MAENQGGTISHEQMEKMIGLILDDFRKIFETRTVEMVEQGYNNAEVLCCFMQVASDTSALLMGLMMYYEQEPKSIIKGYIESVLETIPDVGETVEKNVRWFRSLPGWREAGDRSH